MLLADLLSQAGNAQKMDKIFQEYSLRIFGLMKVGAVTNATEMTHETLQLQRSFPEQFGLELNLLRQAICVADFYYVYHVLRSIWQSSDDMSALLEKDDVHLQNVMDFLVRHDSVPNRYDD